MDNSNYYTVLGVNYSASLPEIKAAYRTLAKKYHPDKKPQNKDAEEYFEKIQDAYYTLSDAKRRSSYNIEKAIISKPFIPYNGNAYQYAQQYESLSKEQPTGNSTERSSKYTVEFKQLLVSVIIALILLYFIVSY